MAATLAQMVEKGVKKLRRKGDTMKANYDATKSRMKDHYDDLPFNSRIKEAYKDGVDDATFRAPDPEKWGDNWKAKMS